MAVSAVQMLKKRQTEHGKRVAAVEGHDATVRHGGNGVAWYAGDGRHGGGSGACGLSRLVRDKTRERAPAAGVVVARRDAADEEVAAAP